MVFFGSSQFQEVGHSIGQQLDELNKSFVTGRRFDNHFKLFPCSEECEDSLDIAAQDPFPRQDGSVLIDDVKKIIDGL
ncbi:hypothetical protein [Rubinisphaera italica]|nr:hypothetical protein [Rubinisphaera italica]